MDVQKIFFRSAREYDVFLAHILAHKWVFFSPLDLNIKPHRHIRLRMNEKYRSHLGRICSQISPNMSSQGPNIEFFSQVDDINEFKAILQICKYYVDYLLSKQRKMDVQKIVLENNLFKDFLAVSVKYGLMVSQQEGWGRGGGRGGGRP